MSAETKPTQRSVIASIVSDKMNKSAVALVRRRIKHPVYGKYITRTSKVHIHDENNECGVGDTVAIVQCCPISKTKSWKLLEVIEKAQ